MATQKERRNISRMDKHYQVFCKFGGHSTVGESYDVSEKGISLIMDTKVLAGDSVEVRIVPKDEIFSFTCVGTVRHVDQDKLTDGKVIYRVGIEFIEGLKDFAIDQLVSGHERMNLRKSIVINAGCQECYEAICNFESYPEWQKMIQSVDVLKRNSDGKPEVVEFWMDAILKKIKFINRYEYFDKDFILSWKSIEGDIKVNEGSYVFQKLREGKTNAVFTLYIELGFYAPKRVIDYLNNISMRNSIRALKETVESGLLKK